MIRNTKHWLRKFQPSAVAIGLGLSLFAMGCGGDDGESSGGATASSTSSSTGKATTSATDAEADTVTSDSAKLKDQKVVTASEGFGTFSGRVVFDGTPPKLDPLVKEGDEAVKDKEVCSCKMIPNESLVIGKDSGITNVVVFLRKKPKGFKSEPPSEPVVLDQRGCRFFPHVLAVQVGQEVQVLSDDAVQHNVHSFPKRNQGVNVLMKPNDREGLTLTYRKAESEPVSIRCDIHSWMASYQVVTDHPFVAITDEEGRFSIEGLPAGEQEFRIWHETGGFLERKLVVEIPTDGTAEKELKFGGEVFSSVPVKTKSIALNR